MKIFILTLFIFNNLLLAESCAEVSNLVYDNPNKAIQLIKNNKINPGCKYDMGEPFGEGSLMSTAILKPHKEIIRLLVAKGVSLTADGVKGDTYIHTAARKDDDTLFFVLNLADRNTLKNILNINTGPNGMSVIDYVNHKYNNYEKSKEFLKKL